MGNALENAILAHSFTQQGMNLEHGKRSFSLMF